jgi:hypothetical protein
VLLYSCVRKGNILIFDEYIILAPMKKLKAIAMGKLAFLFLFFRNKTKGEFFNLKKSSVEEIERTRCKQYNYAA